MIQVDRMTPVMMYRDPNREMFSIQVYGVAVARVVRHDGQTEEAWIEEAKAAANFAAAVCDRMDQHQNEPAPAIAPVAAPRRDTFTMGGKEYPVDVIDGAEYIAKDELDPLPETMKIRTMSSDGATMIQTVKRDGYGFTIEREL
jgi:hypothetical protein